MGMTGAGRLPQGEQAPSILVVEDEPLVRAVAVMHLQERGFSVIEAQDADEAMLILRHDRSIAAVFSDVQMPGSMDGLALAQWLANTRPTVKVLLTSGRMVLDNYEMALSRKALQAGGTGGGVTKPSCRSAGKLGWPFARPYDVQALSRVFREMAGADG